MIQPLSAPHFYIQYGYCRVFIRHFPQKAESMSDDSDRGPRRQLSDEVAGYVRELIMSGQVPPGRRAAITSPVCTPP